MPHSVVALPGRKALNAAFVALAVVVIALWRRRRLRPRGAVFVPGHWLLGNLPEFVRAAMAHRHYELGVKYHGENGFGRTIAIKTPLQPWSVKTTCSKNIEYILKTNFKNYPKGIGFRERLQDLLGSGIFNVDGHEWFNQRKIASYMFTAKTFKQHIWAVVRHNAHKLRNILEATPSGTQVDMFQLLNRFTLDTIGEIGFGKCIGSLEDPSSPFLRSFDRVQQICFWRFTLPWWRLAKLLRMGQEADMCDHLGLVDAYSRSVVRELRAALSEGKSSGVSLQDNDAPKSFVGMFLEDAQKRGEDLSEDYLRDLVLNFLIAGRDTTAQALAWTFYYLCEHPEVEAKAREEIKDVCGVHGASYEDLQRLPYLQAVLQEALRLRPSVPMDIKYSLQDDTWPDGTFVPGGSKVIYDIYSMGRDTAVWGKDAADFRPQRWLDMKESPGSFDFPVFNAGPRECLGKRLAFVEMKACLATLLPRLSLRLAVPAEDIKVDTQLTIGMSSGLPCFVVLAREEEGVDMKPATLTIVGDCVSAASASPSAFEDDPKSNWQRWQSLRAAIVTRVTHFCG